MALNIQFQNLGHANSEILKAFNSQNAANALQAYQPLGSKERAREKLKALQTLKESSDSPSIADITLSEEALNKSLYNSSGATLQAMLNLLSAKMIEQHKNTVINLIEEDKVSESEKDKDSSKEEAKDERGKDSKDKKKKKSKEEEKDYAEIIVKSIEDFIELSKTKILDLYKGILDAVSLKRLRALFEDSIKALKRYAYDLPIEVLDKYVVEPIYKLPDQLIQSVEEGIESLTKGNEKRTFTAEEIRRILKNSIGNVRSEFNDILNRSIEDLEKNIKDKKGDWKPRVVENSESTQREKISLTEAKLKLHNKKAGSMQRRAPRQAKAPTI